MAEDLQFRGSGPPPEADSDGLTLFLTEVRRHSPLTKRDEVALVGRDDETPFGALIASDGIGPEERLDISLREDALPTALDQLPEAERRVVMLRFGSTAIARHRCGRPVVSSGSPPMRSAAWSARRWRSWPRATSSSRFGRRRRRPLNRAAPAARTGGFRHAGSSAAPWEYRSSRSPETSRRLP